MRRFEIALSAPFKMNKITMFINGKGTRYVSMAQLGEATGLKPSKYNKFLEDSCFKNSTGWMDTRRVLKVSAFCTLLAGQLKMTDAEVESARRQLQSNKPIGDVQLPLSLQPKNVSPEVMPAKKVRKVTPEKRTRSPSPVARAEPPRKSLSRSASGEVAEAQSASELPVFDIERLKLNLADQMGKAISDYCEGLRTYVALNMEDQIKKRRVDLEAELRESITGQIRREVREELRLEAQAAEEKKQKEAQNAFKIPFGQVRKDAQSSIFSPFMDY